jgi:hypothetical protein
MKLLLFLIFMSSAFSQDERFFRELISGELTQEKVKEKNRKGYPKRMLKNSIYCKRFHETHKDYKPAYNRAYYLNNKPEILKQVSGYRAKNHDKIKSSNKKYNMSSQGRINRSQATAIRKARINGASIIEKIDRNAIYERDGGICHICHRKVSKKTFTLDHLVPVVHHGDHTAINIAIAHRGCNSRRGAGRIPAQLRLLA